MTSKRLCTRASQILKSNAFDMKMRSSLPDLAIKMLKSVFTGLAAVMTRDRAECKWSQTRSRLDCFTPVLMVNAESVVDRT